MGFLERYSLWGDLRGHFGERADKFSDFEEFIATKIIILKEYTFFLFIKVHFYSK